MRTSFVPIAALAWLALSSCAKEDSNSPVARDAAPGPLSETSPPSPPPDAQTQDAAPAAEKDHPRGQ